MFKKKSLTYSSNNNIMPFKICEFVLSNGEICARFVECDDEPYCCKHIKNEWTITNSNVEDRVTKDFTICPSLFMWCSSSLFSVLSVCMNRPKK